MSNDPNAGQPPPIVPLSIQVTIGGHLATVELPTYVQNRMAQRGVTAEHAFAVLRAPDERNLPADGEDRLHWRRHYVRGANAVDVVFKRRSADRYVIVTVWAS